jgi:hypothetical protein
MEKAMRWCRLALAGLAGAIMIASTAPADARRSAMQSPGRPGVEVDLQLVLAVDVSLSMDNEEQNLQRAAYVAAFRDGLVQEAIRGGGPSGRIAVVYVEWSGDEEQRVVVPWTVIDGPEAAGRFAATLEAAPISRLRRTSISSAMQFIGRLFDASPYVSERRVIDFSGDGSNNEGPSLVQAREALTARGVVINGLPLVLDRTGTQMIGEQTVTLEMYYEQCVIGGTGSFLVPVREMGEFRDALKTKLILEIAAIQPDPDHANVIPASSTQGRPLHCDGRFSF